ncbi:MAG: shikimate kinase [Anaerolineae bacterium]|nr:shikimate kinase [Anaerolineae bacterium]
MNNQQSNPRHSIALAGFMGTGKSSVGRLVAKKLSLDFVDADSVIVERAGKTIAEIFADDGEPAFRALEAEVCRELAHQPDLVIALGGGALLNTETRARFESTSLLVCLQASLDEIIRRVGNDPSRPLFSVDREKTQRLLDSRADMYNSIPYQVQTDGFSTKQVADQIIELWRSER